jgi:all-trans-retinol 13,14-reductase
MILQQLFPFLSSVPPWLLVPSAVLTTVSAVILIWLFSWPRPKEIHPIRASKFRPELVPPSLDTIVIGSGSGGCACANLLAQAGNKVLLLEQHPDRTGGCTHSFRQEGKGAGCEWDTGLHYTSKAMGDPTKRPGAMIHFMTQGLQHFNMLNDPYDEVIFPADDKVAPGLPNVSRYPFVAGVDNTVENIMSRIDPSNEFLKKQARLYMDLCIDITKGFTALGLSRLLPSFLQFLVRARVERLYKFAALTVRDVQYAMFNLGMTPDEIVEQGCPTAPEGPEPDPSIRRLKAVLTHPIGDYAVQPRDATMAAHGVTMAHYIDGACCK